MEHERYKLILDVATEGFWDWDLKSDLAYLSPRYCQLVGCSPEETVFDSKFFRSIIHPDDRDRVFTIIGEHLQGKRDISVIEYRMISRDGTVRWIEGRGKIVEYDDQGSPTRIVGTIVDISDRKRGELLLQQSEEKFRMAFEEASDAIFWADADSGILINCNRAAEAMLEFPRGEIIGKHQTFLHPAKMAEYFADLFRRTVALHARVDNAEAIVVSRSGRRIPVHIKHSLTSVGGRNIMQGLFRDISERLRAEEHLVELNRKLRALSDHLQTVQERERQAMARDIHDEIGQSLTVLKLDLEWIEHRLPAEGGALRERMSEMRSSIELLTSAVQRIAADLRPPLLDSLGLAAAIDWQVAEFSRRSGLECFVMLNEDVDPLDQQISTAVMRIVQEGLTNVLRHARATEVSVSLCTREGQLVLEIGDNGRGIRPEEIVSPQAYGLMGMQERARICRGELQIGGMAGGGTLLQLTIPLREGERSP